MHINEVHDLFQLHARANGRSEHTRNQFARHVRMLESWLVPTNRSTEIEDIDHVVVAHFLCSSSFVEKRDGGVRKATSANAIRSSLRCFFAWAHAAGYAQRNPAALVRRARCSPAMGRVLTSDEVRRLEETLACARGPEAERDRVMVGILLGCGLRVGSLIALAAEDVRDGEITIRRAKNDAPAVVFVPRSLRPMLDQFVAGRTGPLFVGRRGRPLTTRHVARVLQGWCEVAGVRPCSPHALRRTFGTRLYAACHDALVVSRGLAHRSQASVTPYIGGVEARLREVVGA